MKRCSRLDVCSLGFVLELIILNKTKQAFQSDCTEFGDQDQNEPTTAFPTCKTCSHPFGGKKRAASISLALSCMTSWTGVAWKSASCIEINLVPGINGGKGKKSDRISNIGLYMTYNGLADWWSRMAMLSFGPPTPCCPSYWQRFPNDVCSRIGLETFAFQQPVTYLEDWSRGRDPATSPKRGNASNLESLFS